MARAVVVEIYGLKETVAGLHNIEAAVVELKALHQRIGTTVLEAARARMPRQSGTLAGSYSVRNIAKGAVIYSNLVYAGVSEFGGTIPRFHSQAKTRHKPKAPESSYYVYPAIREKRQQIETLNYQEIERLKRKYLPDAG